MFDNEVVQLVLNELMEHWVKFVTGAALMGAGWLFGRWRAAGQWRRKEFLHRLHISLNTIKEGQPLQIRTIAEMSCDQVFLNKTACDAVTQAANRTTPANPLLPLPKDDYWHYLNAVLNEVAERFALGVVKRDLGLPVTTERYLLCLTSEAAGTVKVRKIRAMLIQKRTLLNLPESCPPLESPHHTTRWETLKSLAVEYGKQPHQFIEVELSV